MGKAKYIVIAALVLAVIGFLGYLAFSSITGLAGLLGGDSGIGVLNISKGIVQVDNGKGWNNASDGMSLAEKDKVKTLAGSEASVVLYESIIISLEPDTTISLSDVSKEHVKINQDSGTTWNKFTGMAGVEGYSVETPTTVATVRGTWFMVGMNEIIVAEGKVLVEYKGQLIELTEGEKFVITDENKAVGTGFIVSGLDAEDKQTVIDRMKKTVEELKDLRRQEIERVKDNILVREAMKQYGVTDQTIEEHLARADNGEYDLNNLIGQAPIKTDSMYKLKDLTEQIIEHNKQIEKLASE